MTQSTDNSVPLRMGTTVLHAEGIRDAIVLVVTETSDHEFVRLRCQVAGPHQGDVPLGAELRLGGTPVLPVIDWCVTEQELRRVDIDLDARLTMAVEDLDMTSRELELEVVA